MDSHYNYQEKYHNQPTYYATNGNYWGNNHNYIPQPVPNYGQSAYNPWSSYTPSNYSYPPPPPSNFSFVQPPPIRSSNSTGLTQVLSSYKQGPTVITLEKKKSKRSGQRKLLVGSILSLALIAVLLWTSGHWKVSKKAEAYNFSPTSTLQNLMSFIEFPSNKPSTAPRDVPDPVISSKGGNHKVKIENASRPALLELNAIPKKTKVVWSFDEDNDDEVFIEDIFTQTSTRL